MRALLHWLQRYTAGFGRDGQQLLLLLIAVACIGLPLFSQLPAWAAAVAAATFAAKVWLVRTRRGIPDRWVLGLLTLGLASATWLQFHTWFGRDAGVTLLVMLMCAKLLEIRARRDTFVVICLGFFLALCQFLFSQSIPTAAMVAMGVVALLTAQVAQNLDGDPAVDTPPPMGVAVRIALRILGYSVPLMLVLFVLFPRAVGPLWGQPSSGAGSTGMSDTMSPGSIGLLAESDELAFRVQFDGAVPPPAQRYFRALVLGQFDGTVWRALDRPPMRNAPPDVQPLGAAYAYTLTQEPSGSIWLYLLDAPTRAPVLVGLREGATPRPNPEATYTTAFSQRERLLVRAESATRYQLGMQETPQSLQVWTQLPEGFNPRTQELGTQLRAQYPDPRALVQHVLQQFREQPYRYTLQPPPLGENGVDDFLFDTRAGFCEHYASAFVVLMRSAGLAARVVTGYQGGEINSADGALEVRQRDAHAWAEVWFAEAGWVRVDPTAAVAPERVELGLARTLPQPGFAGVFTLTADNPMAAALRAVRDRWNAVEGAWNHWVLQYNGSAQRSLLERLGFEHVDWQTLIFGALALLAGLTAAMAARVLWHRPPRDAVLSAYARFEARLARAGLARAPHEPPQAYALRLRAALAPSSAQAALRIIDAYIALRYRPAPARTDQIKLNEFKRWIAEFRAVPAAPPQA